MAGFAFPYSFECFQYATSTCKETVLGTDSTELNTMNQYCPTLLFFKKIFLFNYEVMCSYRAGNLLAQRMKLSAKFSDIYACKTGTFNSQTIWPSYCDRLLLLLGKTAMKNLLLGFNSVIIKTCTLV